MRVEFIATPDDVLRITQDGRLESVGPFFSPFGWAQGLMLPQTPHWDPKIGNSQSLEVVVRPRCVGYNTVKLPGIDLKNAANSREHAMVRHKRVKAQRESVRLQLQSAGVHRLEAPMHVQIVRLGPGKARDTDDLPVYGKIVRDEIAAMLGYDDRDIMESPPLTWAVFQRVAPTPSVEVTFFRLVRPPDVSYKKKPTHSPPTPPSRKAQAKR